MNREPLPNHWKIIKFGEVVNIKNGINFSSKQKGSGILTVDVLNMYSDSINISMEKLYRVNIKLKNDYFLEANDILFVRSSFKEEGVGWAALFPGYIEPVTFCGFLIRARLTTSKIYKDFIINYLRLPLVRRLLISKSGKVAITNINQETLRALPIPIPPLKEQQAIARALRAVQETREARRQEAALERERKAALMDYLFTHGTHGEPRQQTEIGEIPESWRVEKLGKIVTLQRGKDLPVQNRNPGNIPVIGSNGIVGWHNQSAENVPIPGVATGRSGSIGLLTYEDRPYWPLNTVLYVSNFHGNDPLFVYYWLHLFDFKKYSQGVSVPTLNRNLVSPVPFPLPPLPEQKVIANAMQACDTKIAALEQEAALLEELFRAMLEELMTGRLSALPLVEAEGAP